MSIYATLWALRFPRFGEYHSGCEWVTLIAQAVPGHVGAEGPDPYASFLPPVPESISADLRAVVFVTEGWPKGTVRSGQEYVAPLLVVSGAEYASMPFPVLHAKLCDALRGNRPRLTAEIVQADGSAKLLFEDGSSIENVSWVQKHRG